jgi:hypothetical protein
MTNKTITHEVKLQKSVIIILGVMALALCANVFGPVLSVNPALAELTNGGSFNLKIHHSGRVDG